MNSLYTPEYFVKVAEHCSNAGFAADAIEDVLVYAIQIANQGLPIIYDDQHFSQLVGYDLQYIYGVTNDQSKFYKSFTKKMRSGKKREIDQPYPSLMEIQYWILHNILEKIECSPYAKAYIKGRTLKDNARYHVGKNFIVKVDIKNFFPSIKTGSVYKLFYDCGYTKQLATLFSRVLTLNGHLPQGAPTSPAISNLVCRSLDEVLSTIAHDRKLSYTRYADDIAFSANEYPKFLIREIRSCMRDHGFELNETKTRVMRQSGRQQITGIVVNKKMNVSKERRRRIRQELYYIEKYGIEDHIRYINETRKNTIAHLAGSLSYAIWIQPRSAELKKYSKMLATLHKDLEGEDDIQTEQ
ncbi:retron St85 family RNA-directed DNA polymerase [Chthonobacter albigriseus]|uniref:retron St85 family RNA-directed DNA polymerase n=1 Tax=Chthonobacter albigriseus TaxID=1683161 RepID=UPI0015EF24AA|nr:retron St85 family RNA-directed DNA polymerase [Chthonobacter albigriseus]